MAYDANGNLLSDGGSRTYTYDAQNRLIAVDGVASYGYDFAGQRISKTLGMLVMRYVYDGANLIAEYENGA